MACKNISSVMFVLDLLLYTKKLLCNKSTARLQKVKYRPWPILRNISSSKRRPKFIKDYHPTNATKQTPS